MGVQELIEKYKKYENALYDIGARVACQNFLKDLEQLNESETGHADEAPRYVKNILARLRELPLHDREVWLKAIMGEFEQDFSHAKWREGYEQGKFEGEWVGNQLKDADKIRQELNKPVIPQTEDALKILINMHQFGYTAKKEKRYLVKVKGVCGNHETLNCEKHSNEWLFSSSEENRTYKTKFTRKELEEANFGWVFNCPGIEVLEVEE